MNLITAFLKASGIIITIIAWEVLCFRIIFPFLYESGNIGWGIIITAFTVILAALIYENDKDKRRK